MSGPVRTKMFLGFGREYWKKGTIIECFKFSLYIIAPIACALVYANHDIMKMLITKFDLVHYPQTTPQLSPEEKADIQRRFRLAMEEDAAEQAAKKAARANKDTSMDI